LNDPAKTRFTIPVIRKFIGASAADAAAQPKAKAPKSGSGK